jgi:ketosteroid isomerase-like protein
VDVEEMLRQENAAWNSHDVDRIATFYTDDCIKEDVAVGVHTGGKEAMKAAPSPRCPI